MVGRPLVSIATWLALSPAYAQEEPGAPRIEIETATAAETSTGTEILDQNVPEPPPTPPCPLDTERIYRAGFERLVGDELDAAVERFQEVEQLCPTHRLAPEMKRLALARADKRAQPDLQIELANEQPTLLAWSELLVFQTLHGIGQGLLLCSVADCSGGRALALSGFAGASAGAGLSVLAYQKLRSGQASAIDSGTAWGLWNGLALVWLTEPGDRASPALISGAMIAGTLAGAGAAMLLEPRNGSVSFANSTGIWLGVTALWILLASDADFEKTMVPIELAVTNLGLIGGAIASQYLDLSRGRVLVIDAGGAVGALLGLGVAALIDNDFPAQLYGPLAAVGTVGGLIGTYFLTAALD